MKCKGFTLIELLAVIVILAILALIAIPIVLNVINNSESESARVSAEKYLDAVELAIMNKKLNDRTNKLDGEYEIKDNGKKLESEDGTILNVEYDGNGLTEGIIIIINKKVKKIKQTKIDKWYAYIVSDKIRLFDENPESTMVDGEKFNSKITKLANNNVYVAEDKKVTSMEFLSWGKLPEGYTKDELKKLPSVDLSSKENKGKSIIAYYASDTGKVYIYSEGIIMFSDAYRMFSRFRNLLNIDFGEIDTSNVETMKNMFVGCTSLISLDLNSFDTSKVTDMSYMFDNCPNLISIDLSNFDTSKVTDMSAMFQYCTNLTELDLSSFDTSKVTDMSYMFIECNKLKNLDLSNFDTSKVTDMNFMFQKCISLERLDLSSFDTSSVKSMSSMFINCPNLISLDVSSFDTSNVESMSNMFMGCRSLEELDLSSFDTSKVTDMSYMFRNTKNIKSILVNRYKWITSKASTTYMFHDSNVREVTYK